MKELSKIKRAYISMSHLDDIILEMPSVEDLIFASNLKYCDFESISAVLCAKLFESYNKFDGNVEIDTDVFTGAPFRNALFNEISNFTDWKIEEIDEFDKKCLMALSTVSLYGCGEVAYVLGESSSSFESQDEEIQEVLDAFEIESFDELDDEIGIVVEKAMKILTKYVPNISTDIACDLLLLSNESTYYFLKNDTVTKWFSKCYSDNVPEEFGRFLNDIANTSHIHPSIGAIICKDHSFDWVSCMSPLWVDGYNPNSEYEWTWDFRTFVGMFLLDQLAKKGVRYEDI